MANNINTALSSVLSNHLNDRDKSRLCTDDMLNLHTKDSMVKYFIAQKLSVAESKTLAEDHVNTITALHKVHYGQPQSLNEAEIKTICKYPDGKQEVVKHYIQYLCSKTQNPDLTTIREQAAQKINAITAMYKFVKGDLDAIDLPERETLCADPDLRKNAKKVYAEYLKKAAKQDKNQAKAEAHSVIYSITATHKASKGLLNLLTDSEKDVLSQYAESKEAMYTVYAQFLQKEKNYRSENSYRTAKKIVDKFVQEQKTFNELEQKDDVLYFQRMSAIEQKISSRQYSKLTDAELELITDTAETIKHIKEYCRDDRMVAEKGVRGQLIEALQQSNITNKDNRLQLFEEYFPNCSRYHDRHLTNSQPNASAVKFSFDIPNNVQETSFTEAKQINSQAENVRPFDTPKTYCGFVKSLLYSLTPRRTNHVNHVQASSVNFVEAELAR